MIKIAAIACHQTEDMELIIPVDIWRRAGIWVDIISLDKKNSIILQSGIKFSCNNIIEKSNFSQYNAIYLPGGIGTKRYFLDDWTPKNIDVVQRLHKALDQFAKNDKKYIIAFDEAPKILAILDLLAPNSKIAGASSIKSALKSFYSDKEIEVSNNLITGKNIGKCFDFSFEVVEKLLNKKIATDVKNQILTK